MLKVIVQKYVFSQSTWNQPNLKSRCSTCGRRRIDIGKRRRTQISTSLWSHKLFKKSKLIAIKCFFPYQLCIVYIFSIY